MIYTLGTVKPRIAASAFVAPDAVIIGDVELAEESRPRLVLLYGGDSSQNRSGVDVVSWKNIDGL